MYYNFAYKLNLQRVVIIFLRDETSELEIVKAEQYGRMSSLYICRWCGGLAPRRCTVLVDYKLRDARRHGRHRQQPLPAPRGLHHPRAMSQDTFALTSRHDERTSRTQEPGGGHLGTCLIIVSRVVTLTVQGMTLKVSRRALLFFRYRTRTI